jgi:hypothetical protein
MRLIEKQFVVAGSVTLTCAVAATVILFSADRSKGPETFPLLGLVFLAGCIGGTTNHYRRLQLLPKKDEELRAIASQPAFVLQAIVSPVLGGIFAVAAYLIFAGKLLEGPLFPSFQKADLPYENVKGFFNVTPKDNIDAAKVLFWGFVSGFSERFVPNLLDKFSKGDHQ